MFSDTDLVGPLAGVRVGSVGDAKNYVVKNRIDIVYCALSGTRRDDITDLMEFCERNTIRFRVIPSGESFIPVVKTSSLEFHGSVPVSKILLQCIDGSDERGGSPAAPAQTERWYRDIIDKYMVRHFVRPGITGWAQVSGFRGRHVPGADGAPH
ncbi:MAG: hypothetical protein IPH53_02345 [Flavobacteriales bacterium]|nr:hypothetical protein [Flavobacteriales bacterium]